MSHFECFTLKLNFKEFDYFFYDQSIIVAFLKYSHIK